MNLEELLKHIEYGRAYSDCHVKAICNVKLAYESMDLRHYQESAG